MPPTTYTNDVTLDMPGGKVNPGRLHNELTELPAIAKAVLDAAVMAGTSLGNGVIQGGTLKVTFDDALSAAEKTAYDGDTSGPAGGALADHDDAPVLVEGLYGTTPVVQAAAIAALTDNTTGTAGDTLGEVSGGQAAQINDNFASLAAKIQAMQDRLDATAGIGVWK